MAELALIAYIISFVSLAINLWLWSEIREIKRERQRDIIARRLNSIVKSVQPTRPKSYWD